MVDSESEIHIIRALNEQNPWWTEGKPSEKLAKRFRREAFHRITNEVEKKEISAVIGQRQVGKTTVLYQLVDYLIEEQNIHPKHILYFSFDNPFAGITQLQSKNVINDVLDVYSINILKKSFSTTQNIVYIFFDEITKYQGWSEILKGWYDLKYPIKFIISDSSSSGVLKGSSESLAGRIRINTMLSFKFRDYVNYKHQIGNAKNTGKNTFLLSSEYKNTFFDALCSQKISQVFDVIKQFYVSFARRENEFKTYSKEYMMKDGFPELIDMNIVDCRKKLYDYISLTLQKDLLRMFKIRNPKALENLITFIAAESSQLFTYENMSRQLSITDDTVREYLDYLDSVFLISREQFYAKSIAKRIRKQDKIYLNNVGLRNVLVNRLNDQLFMDSQELGKIAEILVHDHVKRLFFSDDSKPMVFYWRDKNGKEVDVVVEANKIPIPIEVKFKNSISSDGLKGINSFLSQHDSSFGLVITKDLIDKKENLIFIPLWMFLLLC